PATHTRIPANLYFAEDLRPDWRAHHSSFNLIDFRDQENLSVAKRLVPAQVANSMRRHPARTVNDALRLASLRATGGWWVNPYGACGASVERLSTDSAEFVGHL